MRPGGMPGRGVYAPRERQGIGIRKQIGPFAPTSGWIGKREDRVRGLLSRVDSLSQSMPGVSIRSPNYPGIAI